MKLKFKTFFLFKPVLVLNTKAQIITDPRQSKTLVRAGVVPGLSLTLTDVYILSLIPIPLPSVARKIHVCGGNGAK